MTTTYAVPSPIFDELAVIRQGPVSPVTPTNPVAPLTFVAPEAPVRRQPAPVALNPGSRPVAYADAAAAPQATPVPAAPQATPVAAHATPATPVSPPMPPLKPTNSTMPTPLPVAAVCRPTPMPHERSGVHLLTRADLDIVSEMGGRAARLVLRLLIEDRAAIG